VLGLIIFAALGSSMVSASIGVAVLFTTRVHAWSDLGSRRAARHHPPPRVRFA
jgi:hypothetical protein